MQLDQLKRREFMTLLGGAAAWPLAARAQQAGKVPRIGFLGLASPSTFAPRLEGFRQGLRDLGYVDGATITIVYRWAEGDYEQLPRLAAELVGSNVALIVTHATPGRPCRQAGNHDDPHCHGADRRPSRGGHRRQRRAAGRKHHGTELFQSGAAGNKNRVAQGGDAAPHPGWRILNADNPATGPEFQAMETTAQSLNVKLLPFRLRGPSEFVSAFEAMEKAHVEAVETSDDPLSVSNAGALAALATRGRWLLPPGRRR
jgi:putative ABC transport system substrate-binding protein